MVTRLISMLGGLGAGVGLSQFPAYAQAYLQRLGGHVDALRRTVAEFDADAAALGLERQTALVQLALGGDMGARRTETMAATIDRYGRLSADLHELAAMAPVERALHLGRFADPDIAGATLAAFEPALPVSVDALLLAAVGMALGTAVIRLGLGLLRRVLARGRRRRDRLA
ncbi:DUF2937 family protein [Tritonibacter horizontis]|uniref:DUF2937 family protein n=1 Tax=Tritonibacter horizontis TaxID=1768241 RepID=A0A132BY69_9RHOB|nr:DUF2937 family protein [Tritonibacter horizontis]KUP92757.1 hypothetical protein TRIHO_23720 [Tritonibacter horizontis]